MSIADGDLIIDIDDPLGEATEPRPAKGQPRADGGRVGKAENDRIAELERKLADASRSSEADRIRATDALASAREAAEARARAEEESARSINIAKNSHWEKLQSDQHLIESAINTTKAFEAAAKRDYILAREQADAGAEADAMARLAEHRASLGQLDAGLADAKDKIARTRAAFAAQDAEKPATVARPEPPTKVADPEPKQPTADEWIESTKSTIGEDGANWLREHREFVTDNVMHQKLLTFAKMYELDHGQGALKAEAFREALDAKFFPQEADDMTADDAEPSPSKRADPEPERRTAPSAPVSRTSSNNPGSTTPRPVRLTPDEQSVATQMYPNLDRNAALKRYASNKARATAAGRYS